MAVLYDHIRAAPVVKREVPVVTGDMDSAFAGAARVIEAEYEWPFQSHANMGPACVVVDARPDHSPNAKGNFQRRPGVCGLTAAVRHRRATLVVGPGSSAGS